MTADERAHYTDLAGRLETLAQGRAGAADAIDILEAAQFLRDACVVHPMDGVADFDQPHLNTPVTRAFITWVDGTRVVLFACPVHGFTPQKGCVHCPIQSVNETPETP